MDSFSHVNLLRLTARIVVAHVEHNPVAVEVLPSMIRSVYVTLATAGAARTVAEEEPAVPAVPVRHSVFPDYIICLEDGRRLKRLKRHLRTGYGMTPAQYREKWGLPENYPMAAPAYADRQSRFAKEMGLGKRQS